jgi:hypothetical protein
MEIDLEVVTTPDTITRAVAASKIAGGHLTMIDRACKADKIDWGWYGRLRLIVLNEKWDIFLKESNNK